MKVTIFNAISIDGYIAKPDGDSDWVSEIDSEIFASIMKEFGCIAVGRTTFEQYHGSLYPIKKIVNLVLTSQSKEYSNARCCSSPEEAIKTAQALGFSQLLVVGGGKTNASFLKANLVDEIILDIHPIILGNGIRLFEGFDFFEKFVLRKADKLGGNQILITYGKDI